MCKNSLSKNMYDYLIWHLNKIQKEQDLIFKEVYTEETQESKNFESFFKDYHAYIKNYLNTVSIDKEVISKLPFVIIGSIVDVQDTDDMEDYRYQIVLPYTKQHDTKIECASCLSPLGKSLLFKGEKEIVNIQIPTGKIHYTIKKVIVTDSPENVRKRSYSNI